MIFLRKMLVWLRNEHSKDRKQFYTKVGIGTGLLIVIGLLLDVFLPMNGLPNIVRSLLLVPTALGIFSIGYGVSLELHERQTNTNPYWVPFRSRYSPAWRYRLALIAGAIVIVAMLATSKTIGYTLISSVIGAFIIAVLTFIRQTKEEADRAALGIPDARDLTYEIRKNKLEDSIAKKKEEKWQKRRDILRGESRPKSE